MTAVDRPVPPDASWSRSRSKTRALLRASCQAALAPMTPPPITTTSNDSATRVLLKTEIAVRVHGDAEAGIYQRGRVVLLDRGRPSYQSLSRKPGSLVDRAFQKPVGIREVDVARALRLGRFCCGPEIGQPARFRLIDPAYCHEPEVYQLDRLLRRTVAVGPVVLIVEAPGDVFKALAER